LPAGAHDPPLLHATQVPLPLQTPPVHGLPAVLLVVAVHADIPLPHAVVPFMQALEGVHVSPGVHAEQVPLEQTRLVPHDVPLVIAVPLSAQVGAPLVQEMVPV
jgi:hypothetical protein